MPYGDYVAGALCFAFLVGAAAFAAWRVTGARLAWMAPEARIVGGGLVFLLALALSTGVPLALGILSRGTSLITALLVALAAWRVRSGRAHHREAPRGTPSGTASWAMAGVIATIALAFVIAFERRVSALPVHDIDSVMFILPTLEHWVHSGTMWQPLDYIPGWGFGAYPNTGGLLQLVPLLSWHAEFAVRAVGPALMMIGALAVHALARELGAPRAFAVIAAVLAFMLPAAVLSGLGNAQTDALAAAGIASGALFLVRHGRTGRRMELVLAALGFGLAFGSKWYAPPEIAAVLAAWAAGRLLRRRPLVRVARQAAGVGLGALGLGAIWLIRNAVEYGNPLFPSAIRVLGIRQPPNLLSDQLDWSLLHYAGRPGLLADPIFGQLVRGFALAGGLAIAGALIALVIGRRQREPRAALVGGAALLVLAVYVTLPYTALGFEGHPVRAISACRYAVPGFMLAFGASAWAVGRLPRWLQAASGVAALAAVVHEIDRLAPFGPEFEFQARRFAVGLVAVGVLAAAGWALSRMRRRGPVPVLAIVALVAVCAAAAGRIAQKRFMDARVGTADPTVRALTAATTRGATVGLAGAGVSASSVTVMAFGPRFQNDVRFIGPRVDGLLQRDRDGGSFRRHLRAAAADYLIVGTNPVDPAPELGWAAQAGWRPRAASTNYVLLAPDRPRSPGRGAPRAAVAAAAPSGH